MLYILKMWLLDNFSFPVAVIYCLMEKTLLSWLGSIFYIYENSITQFNLIFTVVFLKQVILCRKTPLKFLTQG